jgi:exodeoxyribonuclease VII large subunit
MVVPDRAARRELLVRTRLHLARAMRARLAEDGRAFAKLRQRLGDPRLAIAAHQQTLDDRRARMSACLRASLRTRRDALGQAQRRLAHVHPRAVLARERAETSRLADRLRSVWTGAFERRVAELQRATARLDALSPLKVLARGYAIATRDDGRAIRSAADVRAGDAIHVRVHAARIDASVDKVEPRETEKP